MVPAAQFPRKQVRSDGTAHCPIFLSNDTDSGMESLGQSTPVKALGGKHQLLASTPKPKPTLLVAAQQQKNELAAKKCGAPHGADMKPILNEVFWP